MPFLILRVGADGGGGTPVPIPNTAVKPTCAENTWLEAARENKQVPTQRFGSVPQRNRPESSIYSSIAQSVEQLIRLHTGKSLGDFHKKW